MINNWKIWLLLLAAAVVNSCTATNNIYLTSSGSGNGDFYFQIDPFLLDYIISMDALDKNSQGPIDIYKVNKIKEKIDENNDVELLKLESPETSVLNGKLKFNNVTDVFESDKELKNAGIISLAKNNGLTEFYLHLTKKNYKQLSIFSELIENPLFETFGPEQNEGISDEEYYELMEYVLGENGVAGLRNSFIEIRIFTDSKIIDTNGIMNDKSVLFKIPLIRILLLDKPIDYFLVF